MNGYPMTKSQLKRQRKQLSKSSSPSLVYHLSSDMSVKMASWASFQLHKYLKDATRYALFCNEVSLFVNDLDHVNLSAGAARIKTTPNAGGSSLFSEVMSFEVLRRTLQAKLLKTEMELTYNWPNSKITDYSVHLFNQIYGVSVTRAMKYKGKFKLIDAELLLTKKLKGVICSSQNVTDNFFKQILHVFAQNVQAAKCLKVAFRKLHPDLKFNTVVVVTVVNDADWIFFEKMNK